MFPFERTCAEFGLKTAVLRGDLPLAKSCYISLKANWHWLDWNLPIIAAESLSFVPEISDYWSFISGITSARKSRTAYVLSKMLFIENSNSVVADFAEFVNKNNLSGPLCKHIQDKPVSPSTRILAFAVDYLEPIVRFKMLTPTAIDLVVGRYTLPWWGYSPTSLEGRAIKYSTFQYFSNELFEHEFNLLYDYIVINGYPIPNHVDYWEGLVTSYAGDMEKLASQYFDRIDNVATAVVYTIEQAKQGEHGDWFGMVGEE